MPFFEFSVNSLIGHRFFISDRKFFRENFNLPYLQFGDAAFLFSQQGVGVMFQQLEEMSVRLENVVVEHKSFEKLIPHYDREDAFFYGDPP